MLTRPGSEPGPEWMRKLACSPEGFRQIRKAILGISVLFAVLQVASIVVADIAVDRRGHHNRNPTGTVRDARQQAGVGVNLEPRRSLLHFKFDSLAFIQALVAVGLNGREMYEYILAGLPLDEPVAFGRIKPLNRTLFSTHC